MFVLERQTENPCEAGKECVPGVFLQTILGYNLIRNYILLLTHEDDPCEAGKECVPGDSCEKFTAEKEKLAGLSLGSDERKMLLERLQSLVCNKEEKKVCCNIPSEDDIFSK